MYNWYAVNTGQLCPTGWHVPTDTEWTVLTDYLAANGHNGTEGTVLKSTSGWDSSGNGTDDYGWSGLPGGSRNGSGQFYNIGLHGSWWSSSMDGVYALYRQLNYNNDVVLSSFADMKNGFSVRCLKD